MTHPLDDAAPALELRGITKRFGAVTALDDVSVAVRAGRVHALLGENGAGKTTLMRVAYGLLTPDAGRVSVHARPLPHHDVRSAIGQGLGMVHQQPTLVPTLTAAENVVLGGEGRLDLAGAARLLERLADEAGLRVRASALAGSLSVVEQQRLEILKSLARGARILILDEPTAVLAPSETTQLLEWVRGFAAGGGSVVLITHKLREALAVAHSVTILRRGRVVHDGPAPGSDEGALARAMFPDAVADAVPAPSIAASGPVVVRATNVGIGERGGAVRVRNATFEIRRHEIVGIAAIEGSGHRALIAALGGTRRHHSGQLELPPRIQLIPADRLGQALIPGFDVTENVALRDAGARRGLMRWPAIRQRARRLIGEFGIVVSDPALPVRTLSGGNQQRLVVARALEEELDLLIADNPTSGLDLRATAFVHEQLRRAAQRGAAVVVHSSDLDEVLALAHRVLVMFDGELREVDGGRDAIGRAMLGAA